MTKNEIEKVDKKIVDLLSELGVVAKIKLSYNEADNVIDVQIDSEEPAILIGFHGETLQAIQLILSFMVNKILGNWVKVLVNVGDYREKREEQLKRLALNMAMKVKFSREAQALPNLSSSERRIVHMALSDHPDVYTQSEGEGRERQLVIKPKV